MGASFLSLLLLLLFSLPPFPSLTTAANRPNLLQLFTGLNISFSPASFDRAGEPTSHDRMFTVATPTLDGGGLFFPIVSSPAFRNTSANIFTFPASFGYSLGFYLKPNYPVDDEFGYGYSLYMAVCAGSFGNISNTDPFYLSGALTNDTEEIAPDVTVNGFAAPVWIANLSAPISYIDQASLTVQDVVVDSNPNSTGTLELQLRDGNNIVWQFPLGDADTMEMQDTGHLLIYNSAHRSPPVSLQISPTTDTLVQGQSLAVGKQLVSNDSSYTARMEEGGLVFYMNKTHFNREAQPPPYWSFPLYRGDAGHYKTLNQIISSAPCHNSPAHIAVGTDPIDDGDFDLHPGSCISNHTTYLTSSKLDLFGDFSWVFWRLESDGMLYGYAIFMSARGTPASVARISIDTYGVTSESSSSGMTPLALRWQECSVPMACGPLGLCTPGAKSFCTCWVEPAGFQPVNASNLFQGCKRTVELPRCTGAPSAGGSGTNNTGGSSTSFVELDSTASIFLFNEWTFNSTPGVPVNACKQACSSDCSCKGFFYEVNTSSCFFMTDEITLLRVADKNYTSIVDNPTFTAIGSVDFPSTAILAKNYVTYLKVASNSKNISSEFPQVYKTGKRSRSSRAGLIALGAIVPSILIILAMAGYLFKVRRRKYIVQTSNNMLFMQESKELQDILPLLPSRFSYKELFEATQGFSKLLGAGGCGSVYAGLLSDGRKVAVKVLQVVLQGTEHSKQFLAEIASIGRINHHNIVRLVGFCWEVSQRLLVYEYVEGGSLDRWIFVKFVACGNNDSPKEVEAPLLDWKTRYNVALGIARGLTYLHEECEKPILHFDIKPQNILLDNDFVAKLADFGMSRLIEKGMSTVVTGMRGTPGYIAPEWSSHGSVSKKSDVYSMGMVLLEIVGGRKNLDFSLLKSSSNPTIDQEAWHFPTWAAKKCEQGLIMELIDHRLCGLVDVAQALNLIHIAFWCIQENPTMRPRAATVVQWLEGKSCVEKPPFSMALNIGKHPNELISTLLS